MVEIDKNNPTIRNPNSPLPQGWRWVKLGELFDVQQGVAMSPQRREGISPHSFLRTLNVLWEHIDLSMLDEMDFTDEEVTKLSLKRGDLLVCEGGEVGRTAIWRGELEGCLHQNHIHRLRRLNDNVVPDFYMYWMQAAFQVFGSYSGQESKTTIPNLSGSRLKSFTVPLLPVEEQRRIAAKIQELMAEVEHARTACEKQLEAAKALPSSYLRQAFESEDARKWEGRRLGELFHVQQGAAMSPARREGISPHPFLRTLNVLWGHIDLSMLDEMDFTDEEVAKLSLRPNDLLVCEGGEVGRTAIWRGELRVCLYQNHIHRLRRLNDNVVPDFYMYWMQAAFQVFGAYSGQESKTTIPNLSGSQLKSFKVPRPSIEKQKRIASELRDKISRAEKLKAAIEKQLEAIDALPQAILKKAFSGEM